MSSCCLPISTVPAVADTPKKCNCPVCGKTSLSVTANTMRHHLKAPWLWVPKPQGYYFCETTTCEVAYFGENGDTVRTTDIRTMIGVKDLSPQALVCYCYGVTQTHAKSDPTIRNFVIAQTKEGACNCTTRNPSGLCCLKNFSK